jgi:hypothetical protein
LRDKVVSGVIFHDLDELGYLRDDCLFKTIEGISGPRPLPAFALSAKIGEAGHRSLTIIDMDDGVYLKIIAKNGEKISRGAPPSRFNARLIGQAVSAYIQQLPLRQIFAQKAAARMANQGESHENDDHPPSHIENY